MSQIEDSVQFSTVQSLSRVRLFATPWITASQASLSITNSRSPSKPMSIKSVMPSNHLILYHPLLLLPSIFPSIRVFSNESALRIRWPKYWSFSFYISPSNEYPGLISFSMDWLDLLAVQGTRYKLGTAPQKTLRTVSPIGSQSRVIYFFFLMEGYILNGVLLTVYTIQICRYRLVGHVTPYKIKKECYLQRVILVLEKCCSIQVSRYFSPWGDSVDVWYRYTMHSRAEWNEKLLSCVWLFVNLWTNPWNSPGQNTGVGSLSLLHGIFPTQESNPGLLHCKQILYQLSYVGAKRQRKLLMFKCFVSCHKILALFHT